MSASPPGDQRRHPLLLVLAGWLLPGSGFLLLDRSQRTRGLLLGGLVHLTFFLGILLQGGVVWPYFLAGSLGTNVVNVASLVIGLMGGWPALLSLLCFQLGQGPLLATESGAYYELGALYCLTAGALNYFLVIQTLERNRRRPFEKLARA